MIIDINYLLENNASKIASDILNNKNNCVIDLQDYADYINVMLINLNINDCLHASVYIENNEPASRVNNFDEYNYINAVCSESLPASMQHYEIDILNYMDISDINILHSSLEIRKDKNYIFEIFIKKLSVIARLKEYIFFID